MKAKLDGELVTVDGTELFETGWYGKKDSGKTVLSLIESCLLLERGRLDVEEHDFKSFFNYCSAKERDFVTKFLVYRDLRERGLAVRMGFKDCDFRVYERGKQVLKWIVFVEGEDYPCKLDIFSRMNKLSKNIRAEALLAVVDNDTDVTFYKISELEKL
jgi:tRNA-intron endonuclease, archaea type